jgi:hypothetical protein
VTGQQLISGPEVITVGDKRLRLQQRGPEGVEVHELIGESAVWVAQAYFFDHPEGPLFYVSWSYRELLGAHHRDPRGAAARAVIGQAARALFAPCVHEFSAGPDSFLVVLVDKASARFRVLAYTREGVEPVCGFTAGQTAPAEWFGTWSTSTSKVAITAAIRDLNTTIPRRS